MVKKRVKKSAKKIIKTADRIKKEVKKNMTSAIMAAFAFIIALVWRDAIQQSVDTILEYIGATEGKYIFKIFSAILVTFIAVLGIMITSRWAEKEK